jgi:hypothetical protein
MIEEASKSNLLDQMVNTLIRGNGSRSSMKLYSASALTIALIFGIIQRKFLKAILIILH